MLYETVLSDLARARVKSILREKIGKPTGTLVLNFITHGDASVYIEVFEVSPAPRLDGRPLLPEFFVEREIWKGTI